MSNVLGSTTLVTCQVEVVLYVGNRLLVNNVAEAYYIMFILFYQSCQFTGVD